MATTLPKGEPVVTTRTPSSTGSVGEMSSAPFSRRRLLAGGGILAASGALAACGSGTTGVPPASAPTDDPWTSPRTAVIRGVRVPTADWGTAVIDGVRVAVADWVIAENQRPGTLSWILGGYPPAGQHLEASPRPRQWPPAARLT